MRQLCAKKPKPPSDTVKGLLAKACTCWKTMAAGHHKDTWRFQASSLKHALLLYVDVGFATIFLPQVLVWGSIWILHGAQCGIWIVGYMDPHRGLLPGCKDLCHPCIPPRTDCAWAWAWGLRQRSITWLGPGPVPCTV